MNVYGVLFAFSGEHVLLIRKAKPAWQAGYINGIGGKREGEESVLTMLTREFREETGLYEGVFQPIVYHSMLWPDYEDHKDWPLVYFAAMTITPAQMKEALINTAMSVEPCGIWKKERVNPLMDNFMPNLPFLVEMAECMVLCDPDRQKQRTPIIPTIAEWAQIIAGRSA